MLPRLALSVLVWSPRVVCIVASAAWRALAQAVDAPRVASDALFVFVDGALTATACGPDLRLAPVCETRAKAIFVTLQRCSHVDIHVAGAQLTDGATVRVDALVPGSLRPFRWRQLLPPTALAGAQRVLAADALSCETALRVYVPDLARGALALALDTHEGVCVYRLQLLGVRGRLTRVRPGHALFPNGPFSADVHAAAVCVRLPDAELFVPMPVGELPLRATYVPTSEPRDMHVLRMPVDADLVVVRLRLPLAFSHIDVPPTCTVRALLLDGSVVTICACNYATRPFAMPVPLFGVVEARFSLTPIACTRAFRPAGGERERALRVVADYDGEAVLLACAPIIVA
jgi:hypothetical protein